MALNNEILIIDEKNNLEFSAYGFVYITTNMINGRRYVGSKVFSYPDGTSSVWKGYLGSGKAMKNAIEKYGKENFIRDIIHICKDKDELEMMETYYILLYNAPFAKEFYNIKAGSNLVGNPYAGKSEEEMSIISKKLSENTKRIWKDGKTSGVLIKNGWNKVPEERRVLIRKRISESNKKIWANKTEEEMIEFKNKIRNSNASSSFKGKSHSEETKIIMSQIALNRFKEMDGHYLNKTVYKYNDVGELVEAYDSLTEACNSFIGVGNINTYNGAKTIVTKSINDGVIVHGFRFSYGEFEEIVTKTQKRKGKENPVKLIDLNSGLEIVFKTITELSDFLELPYMHVYKKYKYQRKINEKYMVEKA